jgi:hypothetical protein
MRIAMKALGIAALVFGSASGAFAAEGAAAAKVTYLTGEAKVQHGGAWSPLQMQSAVTEGDRIETAKGAKLELTLADKSLLRLDGATVFTLKAASLQPDGSATQVTGKITVGRIWAKVASILGGSSHFDIETQNAVAGVRGTTFRVDAHRDDSALVRVYAGAVAVATRAVPSAHHAGKPGERQEVAGPKEVTKKEYEKLLAAMMQVKVSANGELSEPEKFAAADDQKDAWVVFNQQRDEQAQ